MEKIQKIELAKRGSRFIWASDEFYFLADLNIPSAEIYEDFSQLENGVGMVRYFWDQWQVLQLPFALKPAREIIFVTGKLGEKVLKPVIDRLNSIQGLKVRSLALTNTFFGPSVTVAGLLTGSCLLQGLKELKKGTVVFIPESMIQSGNGKFLDDLTPDDVARILGIRVVVVPVEAEKILAKIMEMEDG